MPDKRILALPFILVAALVLTAYTSAPPSNKTGAPGSGTCRSCHSTYALNSGSATFQINGPGNVAPGAAVPLTVAFTNSTMPKWGFEITARDDQDNWLGSWTITDPTNTGTVNNGKEVGHKAAGTAQSSWQMEWQAPANLTSTFITFYAAGVEANNGNGDNNDYVYTTNVQIPVGPPPMTLAVSSTSGDLQLSITGSTTPSQANHEFWVLPSLDTNPGPLFGLMPTGITWFILASPPVIPGVHNYLDGSGNMSQTWGPGTLSALTGVPISFVAVAVDPTMHLSGVTDVVTITP